MTIKNNSGNERMVNILFEANHKKKRYVVYIDKLTDNIYGGRYVRNKIKPLEDKELVLLNMMLEKLEGVKI